MKKSVTFIFAVAISLCGFSQKINFEYVDSIVHQIPEFKTAQAKLDKFSADWQKKIEDKYLETEKLSKKFLADKKNLTQEMIKKCETEIANLSGEVKELQKEKFGVNGELFRKRNELLAQLQSKIFKVIHK